MLTKQPLNPWSRQRLAQKSGENFEAYVRFSAMRDDVMAIQNGLRAKWVQGRLLPMRTSLLDFFLVSPSGQVAMVDAKQFRVTRFGISRLEGHQRHLAITLAERGTRAGFVCHLAEPDVVIYLDGKTLARAGARQGFGATDGVALGTLKNFSLLPIFAAENG